jgi:adenine phosphoribosyltransferase
MGDWKNGMWANVDRRDDERGDDRPDGDDGMEFAARRLNPSPSACDNTGVPRMPDLKTLIREVPDFPKPGILFYDITTLLKDKAGFRGVIDGLKDHYRDTQVDVVLGIEARGFIFAPALAYAMGAGFVPVRKPKKLPAAVVSVTYDLEYGTDTLEMHADAVRPGDRVLIVDDLLATGGTAAAAARLVTGAGGIVVGLGFVVELTFLGGRARLSGHDVFSLLAYDK